MFAGAAYYMRHRLKRLLKGMRGSAEISSPPGTQTEVAENQP
jgi:hypothetical protein